MEDIMKKTGMTDNEVKVYTTLLKIGSSNVSSIAKNSGLYRPYVYDTLKRLMEKGLVSNITKDNKKFFAAINPERLIDIENEKIEGLKTIIPSLKKFSLAQKEDARIELYSGKMAARTVLKDVLKTLTKEDYENLVIGVDENKFKETDEFTMNYFFSMMKKNRFREKVLVREGDNYLPGNEQTTTYRFLPKEFFDPTSINIYGSKVAITIFSEPMNAIIIESKAVADAYRKQFRLLWKIAKDKP